VRLSIIGIFKGYLGVIVPLWAFMKGYKGGWEEDTAPPASLQPLPPPLLRVAVWNTLPAHTPSPDILYSPIRTVPYQDDHLHRVIILTDLDTHKS
jgi:hypothetical protein